MFLAVDIGNSFTKFGLFDGDILTSKFPIPTKRDATADDIKFAIGDKLPDGIVSVAVCSVVPDLENGMREFLGTVTNSEPLFVRNTFDFGLKIRYEPLESLGTDRIVAAYAAAEKYGVPCVVCSLGTATTIDVVNGDREFLGGIIAPGMDAMAEALHAKAPRLPQVAIDQPSKLLGNSTVESIRSGVYNGYLAMVSGLIARGSEEVEQPLKIVTGGNAKVATEIADVVDPDLIFSGLRMIAGSIHGSMRPTRPKRADIDY